MGNFRINSYKIKNYSFYYFIYFISIKYIFYIHNYQSLSVTLLQNLVFFHKKNFVRKISPRESCMKVMETLSYKPNGKCPKSEEKWTSIFSSLSRHSNSPIENFIGMVKNMYAIV